MEKPYETPPDIIDLDSVIEENRDKQMRRYAVLSSLAYEIVNDKKKAEQNMKEYLPYHSVVPELTDSHSTTIIKQHQNKPSDVIIAYKGTSNLVDAFVDVAQIVPGSPLEKLGHQNTGYFRVAQDKYNAVKSAYPNANITTTGHSLGSSLAYYIGKTNDVKSYIFNAGSSPLDIITDKGLTNTDNNKSTHYYVPGDIVGASKALLGSNKDDLVAVKPKRWLFDLAKSIGVASVGGLAFGPAGAVIGGLVGAGGSILDLHGLGHFLPDSAFKGKLDKNDLMYRWVKPIETLISNNNLSKRGKTQDFNSVIIKDDFFKKVNKLCNKDDPQSKCYNKGKPLKPL
jgi:hypothetical protein